MTRRSWRPTARQAPDSRFEAELHRALRAPDGEDEKAFERLWRYLGLSVDWSKTYATVDRRSPCAFPSGLFCGSLERGLAYQLEAPTLWDVDFRNRRRASRARRSRTARCLPSHSLQDWLIATTPSRSTRRGPKLIPACVALVAHPDDER